MTVREAVSKVLETAANEIGYLEKASNSQLDSKTANAGSGNWTKYARDIDKLGITWGNKNGYAWCAEFVLWVFVTTFDKDIALDLLCSPNPTGIPVCSYGASYFKQAGRWFSRPQPGDIIFFYSGGDINHTGIVESVSGSQVNTIEGNTSNSVARRSYSVSGDGRIAGYGRPMYENLDGLSEGDSPVSSPADSPAEIEIVPITGINDGPVYQYGDTGVTVEKIQDILQRLGYNLGPDGVDGEIGRNTELAIIAFQQDHDLEPDGVVGPVTMKKIEDVIAAYNSGKEDAVVASGNVYEIDSSQSSANVDISELFAQNKREFKVGDVVLFGGSVHYTSANAKVGKPCKGGMARITQIYQLGKSKHPYHLVHIARSTSNVCGWVDVGSFRSTQ